MKALVVYRPWAELIASGAKDVENRGRRTSYRGPLLIVAGQGWDPAGVEHAAMLGVTIPNDPDAYPTGAIALVDLTDVCSAAHEGRACACSLWGALGQHHWRLSNPRRLTEPMPVRGMPGMFTPADAVTDAVVAQLADSLIDRVLAGGVLCDLCKDKPPVGRCCNAHGKLLCHGCYRRTHFVEVCSAGCRDCARERLPEVLTAKEAAR